MRGAIKIFLSAILLTVLSCGSDAPIEPVLDPLSEWDIKVENDAADFITGASLDMTFNLGTEFPFTLSLGESRLFQKKALGFYIIRVTSNS